MKIAERYRILIAYFTAHFPEAETELHFSDPYQLLVAVILSAQCTDKRVNLVTPALFIKYPTIDALCEASFDELFAVIRSISYPNNKTKHLIGMANMVKERFAGKIPMIVEELTQLPGVGRKTANVITSVIDQQPNMAVDTHVYRVSKRIGLVTKSSTVLKVEQQLIRHLPKDIVHKAHHWLILHGRYTCLARKPKCDNCGIKHICKFFKENNNR